MTYFSDFDYRDNYDDPMVRQRIFDELEEQIFEDSYESVPLDLLEDF
jgi:hypothetical protein